MKLRSYLAVLVLAGVVPLIILTVVVTLSLVHLQRVAADRGLADTVAALTAAVDKEINASIKSLETLAASRALDTDDLSTFYDNAKRVRTLHGWSTIGLIDSTGNHRLNVARPLGAPLPDLRDREYFKQVVATGKPYVSDLLHGRATGTTDIGVAIPVFRNDTLKYVLFAGVDPGRFVAFLSPQERAPFAVVSIVSRDGVFIARNRDHAHAVGQPLPAEYLAQIGNATRGRIQRLSLEGVQLEMAYQRLASTGWVVNLGIPAEIFGGPARRIAWLGGLLGGVIVVVAVGLAFIVARRMAHDIDALTSAASRIGDGIDAPVTGLRVAELEALRRFVVRADEMLRDRLRREVSARNASEHLARLLQEVQRITETALREGSAEGIIRALLASVRNALGCDTATILFVTPDGAHLTPVASDGLREEVVEDLRIPLGRGVAGRIAASERGMIFGDLTDVDVISPFLRDRIKSLIGVPLRIGDRLVGVMHVGASAPHPFTESDLRLLNLVADRVALVLELARLHEAEQAARSIAEQLNEAKDHFLATLSHELRTPLTSILGWVRMLRLQRDDPTVRAKAIDSIERNAVLQARLVDDLLDVSRIVAGKLQLDCRPIDVAGIALAAADAMRPAAETKKILLDVAVDAAATVYGDPARLQQVIGNLLTNAIKFTPEKGEIRVRVASEGDDALISVADTGQGIRAAFLPLVFEAFRQADAGLARKPASGLGLGLAIVRHLVELHGGTVTAESAGEGLGATFTVRLPLHATGRL
jgi:signal transduction histidine kinase